MSKKASAKEPFLPFFVGDFFAATMEWEGEARSLYGTLLMHQWAGGSIPSDPKRVCKLVRWDWELFQQHWRCVRLKFKETMGRNEFGEDEIRLVNPRLEVHRKKTQQLSERNAVSGAKGAAKRWQKDGERHTKSMANAIHKDGERNDSEIATAITADGERHVNGMATRHQKSDGALHSNPSHPIPSHPDPEDLTLTSPPNSDVHRTLPRAAHAKSGTESDAKSAQTDPQFDEIRAAYPKRAGGQRWQDARHAYNARRREGHSHEVILAGVQRYAAHIRAKGDEGMPYVQQAATFLGTNRGFLEPWSPVPTRAEKRLQSNIDAAAEAKRQLLEESQ